MCGANADADGRHCDLRYEEIIDESLATSMLSDKASPSDAEPSIPGSIKEPVSSRGTICELWKMVRTALGDESRPSHSSCTLL